jgi:hypothetical protein
MRNAQKAQICKPCLEHENTSKIGSSLPGQRFKNMQYCALYHDKRLHVIGDCGRPRRTHLPDIVLVRLVLPVIAASVMRRHDGEAAHGALGPLRAPGLRLRMVTRIIYYQTGQTSHPCNRPARSPPECTAPRGTATVPWHNFAPLINTSTSI